MDFYFQSCRVIVTKLALLPYRPRKLNKLYEIKSSDNGQQAMKNCDSEKETNNVSFMVVQAFCLEGFVNSSTGKGIPSRVWQSADPGDRNQSLERIMQLRHARKSARGQRFPWVWLNTPKLCMHKMRLYERKLK